MRWRAAYDDLRRGDDVGAVAILVAAFVTVVFVFLAILVDLGNARMTRAESSGGADAAALAGAARLRDCTTSFPRRCTAATKAVKDLAEANVGGTLNWGGCAAVPPTITGIDRWRRNQPFPSTSCIQYGYPSSASKPTVVFVAMPRRDSPISFAGIVDISSISVTATSVAGTERNAIAPCALCVADTFTLSGNVFVSTDGTHTGTFYFHDLDTSTGAVVAPPGVYETLAGTSAVTWSPDPVVTGEDVVDPFPGAPVAPTIPNRPDATCNDGDTLAAGTYGALVLNTGTCLLSGSYRFDSVDVTGDGALVTAPATTVYVQVDKTVRVTSTALQSLDLVGAVGGTVLEADALVLRGTQRMDIVGDVNVFGSATLGRALAVKADEESEVTVHGGVYVRGALTTRGRSVRISNGDVDVPNGTWDNEANIARVDFGTVYARNLTTSYDLYVNSDGVAGQPQYGVPKVGLICFPSVDCA